ncbi:ABC transporter substrate-binding protein [Vallitalea maricola]|uniref:Uncharacterized protein n=1 Tax=Vallitalea maricola TaxID=3074433 RepID=A0ACB5UH03_9FIRM|nr:hypothetical protein AN2V17_13780 [Vallitalea sp. AN17-2]
MKKIFSIVLLVSLVLSIVGCGNQKGDIKTTNSNGQSETGTSSSSMSNSEVSDEIINLVVWGGVPAESGPQALVNAWNTEHPNIQVEYVRFVNDDTGNTKLDTAILSGEQIDVFFTYSIDTLKKRVEGGMVESLELYEAEEFIKENIIGGDDGQVKINSELYGLSTAKESIGFMINSTMLESQGVTIPDNWSVDEFMEVAKQLTHEKDGHKVYGTHGYYAGLPLAISSTVLGGDQYYSEDGKASNFDAPEFEVNARVKELMDDGYAMPYDEVFSRKLEAYCHSAFLNEEVAMMPFSGWMLRYVKDLENYPHDFITTFAPYPTSEKGVPNNYQATLNNHISISSNSKYKEEAWEFIKFWITDGTKFMLSAGKIPVWNQVSDEEVIAGIVGKDGEKLFDIEGFKRVMLNPHLQYIVDTYTTAYPQIMQIYKEESEMFFLGESSKEDYLYNIKRRADEAIEAELQ